MISLKIFTMIRHRSGDWDVKVYRDLGSVEQEWSTLQQTRPDSVMVLHVGFWRPSTEQLDPHVLDLEGRVVLTDAARHALPLDHSECGRILGTINDMSMSVASRGWGYTIESTPAEHPHEPLPSTPTQQHLFPAQYAAKSDWVAALVGEHVPLAEDARSQGVVDEASYLTKEKHLSDTLREKLGWQRYLYYVGLLPEADTIVDTLIFTPPWMVERKLSDLTLPVRTINSLRAAGVTTVRDVALLGSEGVRRANLGLKSYRLLADELLLTFVRGPWRAPSLEASTSAKERFSEISPHSATEDEPFGGATARQSQARQANPTGEPCGSLRELLEGCVDVVPPRHRPVLRLRMGFSGEQKTLEEIGSQLGVTRERVRQIEKVAVRKVAAMRSWTDQLERRLHALLSAAEFPLPLNGIEILDGWFNGAEQMRRPLAFALRNFCGCRIALVEIADQVFVSRLSQAEWLASLAKAREMISAFAGQGISSDHVRIALEGLLPPEAGELREMLWEHATKHAHFASSSEGMQLVSVGQGMEHVVLAILNESECPLHYSEIARRCTERLGRDVEMRRVHSALCNVGTLYGRGVYGVEQHYPLSDTQVEQIISEAEALIGDTSTTRQWHAREILQLLESKGFQADSDLDPYLVSIALGRSNRLVDLGRMMWAPQSSGAAGSSSRIDVRQAIVALLEREGRPMAAQEIRERLTVERGLNAFFQIPQGGSLIRVSPAVWGLLERDSPLAPHQIAAIVEHLTNELSRRRTGLHISEIMPALHEGRIELPNDLDPMLVMDLSQRYGPMSLARGQILFLTEWGEPRRQTVVQALREIFSVCGPAGLSLDEVQSRLEELVGRSVPRGNLPSYFNGFAVFSAETGTWTPVDSVSVNLVTRTTA